MRFDSAAAEPTDHSEELDALFRSAPKAGFRAAPPRLQGLVALSTDLVHEAGRLQRAWMRHEIGVDTKSSITDFVSDVDRESERRIIERLNQMRPDDSILSEEGTLQTGTSGVRWVIDPLDGTTNYLYNYPAFAVSIAVEVDGKPEIGAVYDSSAACCYVAVNGFGAFCGDRRIHVREQRDLARSLVATGFSYDARQRQAQARVLCTVLDRVSDIRRSGSAALDLCHVAAGYLDAYWELDNGPWDYAAGSIIAREAGASVVFEQAAHGRGPAVVAANPSLMSSFLALLRAAGALA